MTIRRTPQDFVVVERPTSEYLGSLVRSLRELPPVGAAQDLRPRAVFWLHKTSLTTPEAIAQFAGVVRRALAESAPAPGPSQTVSPSGEFAWAGSVPRRPKGRTPPRPVALRAEDIEYAGLKDKHAQTSQLIAVPLADPTHADALHAAAERNPGLLSGPRWSAEPVGLIRGPLTAAAIDGNQFTIVVRGLDTPAQCELERRARVLSDPAGSDLRGLADLASPRRLLVMNYFGAQRFGSARHGQGFVARRLIAGDFEHALKLAIATPARKDAGPTRVFTRLAAQQWGDWSTLASTLPPLPERRAIEALARGGTFASAFQTLPTFLQFLYVEAFQSHLWNAAARRLAVRIAADARADPLRTDDEFGEMVFPPAAALRGIEQSAHWIDLPMPVLAPDVILQPDTGPPPLWAEAAAQALAYEGLTLTDLRIPGLTRPWFGAADRPLVARTDAFALSSPAPDEFTPRRTRRTLSFTLPRGSYATVVLRALGQ